MNDEDLSATAAEYLLGTLDVEERQRFERALEDSAPLRDELQAWRDTLAPLAEADPGEVTPSSDLLARIEKAIDADAPGTLTVRDGEGTWAPVLPGVSRKLLHRDPDTGFDCFLLRLEPGASLPAHGHPGTEECLVLEGGLRTGTLNLSAGDFHRVPAGTPHQALFSPAGALLYLRAMRAAPSASP